jgi:ATP-dependent RNA helicase RhlE
VVADLRSFPKTTTTAPPRQALILRAIAVHESNRLTHFADLGLAEPILRAIAAEGYTTPTPIQEKTIPALLSGYDVTGIAQTGTGKTAAFVLPILDELIRDRPPYSPKRCHAIILTPTRELASQIVDNIEAYGRHIQLRTALIVGGVKSGPQIRALAKGVDIVVATPGRLEDHIGTGVIKIDHTELVVLDEADQMLDLGFLPSIRRIMNKLPSDRQTILFSATMPKQIQGLARDFQNDPKEISVAPAARPIDRIDQRVIAVNAGSKPGMVTDILKEADVTRAVVFTRTKRGADRLCKKLEQSGLNAVAIHGNKSQPQRDRALDAFRAGKAPILVATDIAARGIDIDDVSHVINYELPNVPEAYVHRIGRTARAGKNGIAITLCDPEERGLLRDIERLIGRKLLDDGRSDDGPPSKKRPSRPNRPHTSYSSPRQTADGQPAQKSRRRRKPSGASKSGNSQRGRAPERVGA